MDPIPFVKPTEDEVALSDPRSFINRELSNFTFIERILEEAEDPHVPLGERMRFLGILSVALDEFFMIRVAGLKQQIAGRVEETGPDMMTPAEQLQAISQRCHALVGRQDRALLEQVIPELENAGVRLPRRDALSAASRADAAAFFQREALPVLTPIALDPGHPFPHLRNKSLNLVVRF